jgi:hypothetical protein
MELISALADLEMSEDLHSARLLVLLHTFAGHSGKLEGLSKLAKLDFLLRYPVLLERAGVARGRSSHLVKVEDYERNSVESRMVRFRYGPWDHRYYRLLTILVAKGLISLHADGRRVNIALTSEGTIVAETISKSAEFEDLTRRARILKSALDLTASNLVKFIYKTFPEIVSLKLNTEIVP